MGKAGGRFTEAAGLVDELMEKLFPLSPKTRRKRKTLTFIYRIKEDEKDSSFP